MRIAVSRWPAVLSVVAVIVLSVGGCGFIEKERFARSMEKMERVARTMKPTDGRESVPRRIGLLDFTEVYRDGDLVYFKRGDTLGADPYGYVWSPAGEPVDDPDDAATSSFEHIQGPWYWWSESW